MNRFSPECGYKSPMDVVKINGQERPISWKLGSTDPAIMDVELTCSKCCLSRKFEIRALGVEEARTKGHFEVRKLVEDYCPLINPRSTVELRR